MLVELVITASGMAVQSQNPRWYGFWGMETSHLNALSAKVTLKFPAVANVYCTMALPEACAKLNEVSFRRYIVMLGVAVKEPVKFA